MRWERLKKKEATTMEEGGGGPGKRWGHSCNAIKGGKYMYMFGGYGHLHNSHTNKVHVFDTDTQTWSEPAIKGTLPTPRDSHTCTTVGDNLFVFGGTDGQKPLRDLHILDTSSNTWMSPIVRGDLPEAREGHSAAAIGTRLFIFGGCGKSMDGSREVYYNDLHILDTETFVWQRAVTSGKPPAARDSHSCSSWRDKIIVVGGEDAHNYYLSDVHILDTDTLVWQELRTTGQLLTPRAGHCTIAFGKHIFVFGGFTDAQNLYDDLYMLDLDTCMWTKIMTSGDGPSARFSMSGDCLDPSNGGVVAFVGGCNKNLEALDDMYYLHTELVRDDGRDERRMEKLSLRKQLRMKCQEQYFPTPESTLVTFGTAGVSTSVPNYSQQNQQYFYLNNYRPLTGKRTFQAKVAQNFDNGFTIETVIDGKPLRGILFSTSLAPDFNVDGKRDAGDVVSKLNEDQNPIPRCPTSQEPRTEAADISVPMYTGHSNDDQSQEVRNREAEKPVASNASSEDDEIDEDSTAENLVMMEYPPAKAEDSATVPKNQVEDDHGEKAGST